MTPEERQQLEQQAQQRRQSGNWTLRKFDTLEDMSDAQLQAWQKLSSGARTQAAWDMVVEAWAWKGRDPDELRFRRDVEVVRRA